MTVRLQKGGFLTVRLYECCQHCGPVCIESGSHKLPCGRLVIGWDGRTVGPVVVRWCQDWHKRQIGISSAERDVKVRLQVQDWKRKYQHVRT